MITAGLKLTRNGGLALFRDDRLQLAVALRGPVDLAAVTRALAEHYYDLDDVDEWVVDGSPVAGRATVALRNDGAPLRVEVAGRVESADPNAARQADPARPGHAGNLDLGGKTKSYTSYSHLAGHLAAAYCTSPFAGRGEPAEVLVWDGDGAPRLYHVDAGGRPAPGRDLVVPAGDGPLLAERLAEVVDATVNLCFAGSRALDVTLNSRLAAHPAVKEIWVPPFPDGSGSAFGAAALRLAAGAGLRPLGWSLRAGPELARHPHLPAGWAVQPCRPEELARLLLRSGKPVAVLTGRAKLGPYPLGARSVLSSAADPAAKATLNRIAGHRPDRPLVPICLAKHATEVFDPGGPDPYQRFAHRLRPEWTDRIPALDAGPGPMQTVDRDDDPVLWTVVREFHKWGGAPVLCSAPADPAAPDHLADAWSAMRWGGVDLVWCDNILHRRVPGETA
jgi:predicted NodU family carbamoyl transferase